MDTICATVEDYAQDFVHLKKVFYKATLDKAERKVTAEYLKALFAKYALFVIAWIFFYLTFYVLVVSDLL